ncbi:hypothetical protein BDZ91DRAFT_801748 [Kalaharituber pfeilii]|nr:hypothetical protein BDZ91DRAFT_801748 [Kalaharituber pfeilii]
MPPPGTWAHWFLTNRALHFYFSLSILFSLAGIASVMNFMKTSPYAGLVRWEFSHPIDGVRSFWDALRMHWENESRLAVEKRKKMLEEVEKRGVYRKAHGLEETGEAGRFGGWGLRGNKGKSETENQQEGVVAVEGETR